MKKIEYRKYIGYLIENPGKIFGMVYLYIFFIAFLFGVYYVQNISSVARQSVQPAVPDTTAEPDLKVVEARTIPPVDLASIQDPAQQLIDNGKILYSTVCASCHGDNGTGNGPAGTAINPPPRNFTQKDGWKNGTTFSGLYKTLEEGISGTAMIPYDYMLPTEKIAIAHYLRSAFIQDPPGISQDEVTLLDQTYNLRGGAEISAQIPVNTALEIYLSENRGRNEKIISSIREISSSGSEGSRVFSRITSDRAKAVTTLSAGEDWISDKNRLRGIMVSGVNRNGFNSEVLYLNDNELSELHNYLQSIFR